MTCVVVTEDHRRRARAFAAFIGLNPVTDAPWTLEQIEALAAKIAFEDWLHE